MFRLDLAFASVQAIGERGFASTEDGEEDTEGPNVHCVGMVRLAPEDL